MEWTGGEPKEAEQPMLQPSHWTLEQKASNVGRQHRARPMLDVAYSSVQHTQRAKGCNGLRLGLGKGLKGVKRLGLDLGEVLGGNGLGLEQSAIPASKRACRRKHQLPDCQNGVSTGSCGNSASSRAPLLIALRPGSYSPTLLIQ